MTNLERRAMERFLRQYPDWADLAAGATPEKRREIEQTILGLTVFQVLVLHLGLEDVGRAIDQTIRLDAQAMGCRPRTLFLMVAAVYVLVAVLSR